jgi:uncharacterized protein (TIGR03437 family)
MNRINIPGRVALGALIAAISCFAQTPVTELQVDVNNFVLYNYDTFDTTQFSTNKNATSVPMKTYNYHIGVGDITAVGGAPAKGTLFCTHTMFLLNPSAVPGNGQAIADVARNMLDDCAVEIQTGSGTAVGTIFFRGFFGGTPPPGAPTGVARSNLNITGGTGAFLGVGGQAGGIGAFSPRVASVTEDPANRRANGGGTQSIILQILPMLHPEVIVTQGGPAIVHASDFSLVSASKPAKAGEILTLFASGLGPTNPAVPYGHPFPAGSAPVATSPVVVMVNGNSVQALYAGAYPGSTNGYQVNFQVPAGTTAGAATLSLVSGFIAGGQVTIPVQ